MRYTYMILIVIATTIATQDTTCTTESISSIQSSNWCAVCTYCDTHDDSINTQVSCTPCSRYTYHPSSSTDITSLLLSYDASNCLSSRFTSDVLDDTYHWCTECTACFNGQASCTLCASSQSINDDPESGVTQFPPTEVLASSLLTDDST